MEEARRKAQLHEKDGEQLVDAAAKDAKNEDEAAKGDPAAANDANEKTTAKLDGEETGADEVTENGKTHEDATATKTATAIKLMKINYCFSGIIFYVFLS